MTSCLPFLAFDLGAASGRAVLARPGDGPLELREIHRFINRPVALGGVLYWDFLYLWDNVLEAMRRCAAGGVRELAGVGVDTWNIDFGLVDRAGALIRNPVSYRSPTSAQTMEEIRGTIGEEELYRISGYGYSPITGLARLLELRRGLGRDPLEAAVLLPIADLIRLYLCGSTDAEETVLWGSQLLDVRTRGASSRLVQAFDLPETLLPPVTCGGRGSGRLRSEICQATGIQRAPVFAVAAHDTISAVLAGASLGRASGRGTFAVLCTGSWFILGLLRSEPTTDAAYLAAGAANEIAALGSIFVARNLMGFALLEELMREWRRSDAGLTWEALLREADQVPPRSLVVDPQDPQFYALENPVRSVEGYLERTGQTHLQRGRGAVTRGILEGLVGGCRQALRKLEELTGGAVAQVVVVGGGTRNPLFCRMLTEGMERTVVVGPAEAAVLGNVAMQMMGNGDLGTPEDLFGLLARGMPHEILEPAGGQRAPTRPEGAARSVTST